MSHSPALVLVEQHAPRRTALRRGLPTAVVGVVIGSASFVPFLLSVLGR